jgi:hypothetical protein
MSYGSAAALQAAVYARLMSDADLAALVGGAIYDSVPAGSLPETYVSLGVEEARARGDATGAIAEHDIALSVVSSASGFAIAKGAAAAAAAALEAPGIVLGNGRLMDLQFLSARARRVRDADVRRIELRFRARIDTN